jgi:hydroxymethylpyrimidine pyrophosphatase-like HAD family hydrolase
MNKGKILFATDLDGTLLNDSAVVDPVHAAGLNRMCGEGLLFTVSSARSPRSVAQVLDGSGIYLTAPAVCLNGAVLWDMKKDIPVRSFPIKREAMEKAWAEMVKTPLSCRLFSCDETGAGASGSRALLTTYYRDDCPADPVSTAAQLKLASPRTPVIPFSGSLPDARIISCSYFDRTDLLFPLYSALSAIDGIRAVFYKSTYRENMSFLEFYSASGGKGAGARAAMALCGAERLYVFGDNFNDADMYRVADMSFAPANGESEMKKRASRVIPSNNDGGVVLTIAEYFRGK